MIASVPHLYAGAHGLDCAGDSACFYCGAPCGEDHPTSKYVQSSFTGRNGVVAPGSPWVCNGCVLALREDATVAMIDGSTRPGQKVRSYSWVVAEKSAVAASKAHLNALRVLCLNPPGYPLAIVLSDSGQTHQLYRGVVNHGGARDVLVVTLESERVEYRISDLAARLILCGRLVAASGKPALREPITTRLALSVLSRYPRTGEALLDEWGLVRQQSLSRLASWLCVPSEKAQDEYPPDE